MKMEHAATLAEPLPSGTSLEVFRQLGLLTRLLHDTLEQLGVMPHLRNAADGLPDARSRLNYVVRKTGEAAEKVLNSVDRAKLEHGSIAHETRRIAQALMADPVKAVASGAVLNFVGDVEAATARIDQHLTDIMLAQDFHDLTGQVVAKVVTLATDLEASLVKLLLQVAPQERAGPPHGRIPECAARSYPDEQAPKPALAPLQGPVVDLAGRADVVSNQGEVDDLLASLGF